MSRFEDLMREELEAEARAEDTFVEAGRRHNEWEAHWQGLVDEGFTFDDLTDDEK